MQEKSSTLRTLAVEIGLIDGRVRFDYPKTVLVMAAPVGALILAARAFFELCYQWLLRPVAA